VTTDALSFDKLNNVTVHISPFDKLSNVTVHISPFEILTESSDCAHGLFEILSTVSNVIPIQYGDYECGLF
jgi:hypothetical protein